MPTDDNDPKQLCDQCTTDLVMVAKFREKCGMSEIALEQLKSQAIKRNEVDQSETNTVNAKDSEQNNDDQFFENVEYAEENVEYIIYDSDFIEESDVNGKPSDELQSSEENDDAKGSENLKSDTIEVSNILFCENWSKN